jgi:putative chitinase
MELKNKYKTLLDSYKINTPLRLAHFFAQTDHESLGFTKLKENLNYSVDGLLETFRRERISELDCKRLGRTETRKANQETIANIIYGGYYGRVNLGNIKIGDGFKYIGRGYMHTTGRANYAELSKDTGVDYLSNPEWLEREADALLSACWFWKSNNCNSFADKDDLVGLTKKINGGKNGLVERAEKLEKYKQIFKP